MQRIIRTYFISVKKMHRQDCDNTARFMGSLYSHVATSRNVFKAVNCKGSKKTDSSIYQESLSSHRKYT